MKKTILGFCAVLLLALTACGGGGGTATTPATTTPAATIINGAANLGVVSGGIVKAYAVTNGAKGAQIGTAATTTAQGGFQIDVGTYTGPILFELTTNGAAKYLDEATGAQTNFPRKTVFRTILASVPTQPVAITALTEIATYGALLNGATAQAIADAYQAVQESLVTAGTDIVFTIPADIGGTAGGAASENYAAVLAALAVMPTQDPAAPDLYAEVQFYKSDMFPDRGLIYPANVNFGGGFTLATLVNPTNWTALNNGLRQPATFTPAGATTKATVTTTPSTSTSVAAITYAGPQFGWTGAVSPTGYTSANAVYFTTVTNGCSAQDMQRLIWAYETALTNLFNDFAVTGAQMGITTNNKLHAMCSNQIRGGAGSKAGFQVGSYSAEIANGRASPPGYYALVKHEMVHTFQEILEAPQVLKVHWWLQEGLAVYLSKQELITSNAALTTWKNQTVTAPAPAIENPISVTLFQTTPVTFLNGTTGQPYTVSQQYYPVFGRAVEYLLTPAPIGAGNTIADIKTIFAAMKAGSTFTQAFDATMNTTEVNFQANFYTIMSNFLR